VRFLHLKGVDETRIHHEPEAVLGPDAMPYSSVKRILRSAVWTQTDSEAPHSEIDQGVVQALGELAFASVKELARRMRCAPTTVYLHLTEGLHFVSKLLQWVPYDLTTPQKALRFEKSNELLPLIKSVRHNDPAFLVTLDECSFYFRQDFERQRLSREESPANRVRGMAPSQTVISTGVWNAEGFRIVDVLPK
jgi:hypothetical protein